MKNCPPKDRITNWSSVFDHPGDFAEPENGTTKDLLAAVLGNLSVENCSRRNMRDLREAVALDICLTSIELCIRSLIPNAKISRLTPLMDSHCDLYIPTLRTFIEVRTWMW